MEHRDDICLEEWRPAPLHGHGMMSIFSMAVAKLKKAENKGLALAINIQESTTVYASLNPEGNIWLDYFFQPHEVSHPSLTRGAEPTSIDTDKIQPLTSAGIWGHAALSWSAGTVHDAREMVTRYLRLNPDFQTSVSNSANTLFVHDTRYLAVHVRLGDKEHEAPQNFTLTLDTMVRVIKQTAIDFSQCSGIFLCTDDRELKANLRNALETGGFTVCTYASVLSENRGIGLHFDRSLDKRTKTTDIWHEVVLMARFCYGLVSTNSNVSTMAVYLAPHEYPHRDFWGNTLQGTCGDRQTDEYQRSSKRRRRGAGGGGGGGDATAADAGDRQSVDPKDAVSFQ